MKYIFVFKMYFLLPKKIEPELFLKQEKEYRFL